MWAEGVVVVVGGCRLGGGQVGGAWRGALATDQRPRTAQAHVRLRLGDGSEGCGRGRLASHGAHGFICTVDATGPSGQRSNYERSIVSDAACDVF